MSTYWVCKHNGEIQCQDFPAPVSLEKMKAQLAALIGEENILNAEERTYPAPRCCGCPTGNFNAYEITAKGYELLTTGIMGRMGFEDCGDHCSHTPENDEDLCAFDILRATRATSVANTPVLIKELIGRIVRCYEEGTPITQDYIPERVNIVTVKGRIVDIWFG